MRIVFRQSIGSKFALSWILWGWLNAQLLLQWTMVINPYTFLLGPFLATDEDDGLIFLDTRPRGVGVEGIGSEGSRILAGLSLTAGVILARRVVRF